jgi:hypothetical protein
MSTAFSSALYYPFIEVRDERWLRSACLFWDRIRTIVPESYRRPYSSDFARTLHDEGVLDAVRVSSETEEVQSLEEPVLEYLTDPAAIGMFAESGPTTRLHRDKLPHSSLEMARIHPDKLPYLISKHLDKAVDAEGWLRVEPGFANFYMTLLATNLAQRLGLGLVTDSAIADHLAVTVNKRTAAKAAMSRRGSHYDAWGPRVTLPKDVAPGLLIDLVIDGLQLPDVVPAKKLLKFKRDHAHELQHFKRKVSALTSQFSEESSLEALRQGVRDQYETEVLPALEELRKALKAAGWNSAFSGFLKTSFFSAPGASLALFAGLPGTVALLAGAGLSLVGSAVHFASQRRRIMLESPFAYLLSLDRKW